MNCPIGFFCCLVGDATTAQQAMFPDDLHGIGLAGPYVMKVRLNARYVMTVTAATAGLEGYPPYAAVTAIIEEEPADATG